MDARKLADLIREHQDATGDSYNDIAKRSGLSKPKIGQLAQRGPMLHMPRAETLEKLAVGLDLPLHIVQAAALVTAGVVAPEISEPDISMLVVRYRELPDDYKEIVRDMVAMLYQRTHHSGGSRG